MAIEPTTSIPVLVQIVAVAGPLVSLIVGKLWGEAAGARRAYHAVRFGEEESKAYDEAKAAFVSIRVHAAYKFQSIKAQEGYRDWPGQYLLTDTDPSKSVLRQEAASKGFVYMREVALVGPHDLSEAAVGVIRDFLRKHDDPNRSDSEGTYYENEQWSRRYLQDFVERRQVDLGQMWVGRWYFRRSRRAIGFKFKRWLLSLLGGSPLGRNGFSRLTLGIALLVGTVVLSRHGGPASTISIIAGATLSLWGLLPVDRLSKYRQIRNGTYGD